jgi:hypothetical protein
MRACQEREVKAPQRGARNPFQPRALIRRRKIMEAHMGFGRGALLWLLGIPLPIIILLALFWR